MIPEGNAYIYIYIYIYMFRNVIKVIQIHKVYNVYITLRRPAKYINIILFVAGLKPTGAGRSTRGTKGIFGTMATMGIVSTRDAKGIFGTLCTPSADDAHSSHGTDDTLKSP